MRVCIVTYDEYINIPYINKYETFLKCNDIEYDIILWDRRNILDSKDNGENLHVFKGKVSKSRTSKIIPFLKWRKFTLKILKEYKYDRIIVLTTIPAFLISCYLIKNYNNKYLLDIRDYTYENLFLYKKMVNKLIDNSRFTFISSKGFLTWLKKSDKLILTHNISNIESEIYKPTITFNLSSITIGFVGGIRYYYENCLLIENMKEHLNVNLKYVGKVHEGIYLQEFCLENKIHNVEFEPAFSNNEKPRIYKSIDFINSIYGSKNEIVKTALPNKLYDCILYKIPIIVSQKTYLANIVEEYNLGFAVDIENDDVYQLLKEYINNFDEKAFLDGCDKLKRKVLKEESLAWENLNKIIL